MTEEELHEQHIRKLRATVRQIREDGFAWISDPRETIRNAGWNKLARAKQLEAEIDRIARVPLLIRLRKRLNLPIPARYREFSTSSDQSITDSPEHCVTQE